MAWTDVFSCPEYIPGSSTAASSDRCSPPVGAAGLLAEATRALCFQQHRVRALVSPRAPQQLLAFDNSQPSGREVASHPRFDLRLLTANDVEHLFMCLLAVSIFFGKKLCFNLLFFNWVFIFFLWVFKSSSDILCRCPLSSIWFVNIFSYSEGCLFTFLMVSFQTQKF